MSRPQLPPRAGRPRRSWVLPMLVVLLLVVPLAEVWLLLQVGSWIGLLPTVGLLVGLAIFGTWLSRHEGSRAWKGLNEAVNTGRLPTGAVADAALILIGALLLVFPGFFTDIFGLVFLLPFTRPLAKRLFGWVIAGQAKRFAAGPGVLPPFGPPGYPPSARGEPGGAPRYGSGDVIEGEVVDNDPEDRR